QWTAPHSYRLRRRLAIRLSLGPEGRHRFQSLVTYQGEANNTERTSLGHIQALSRLRTTPAMRVPTKASIAPSPATIVRPAPGTHTDRTNPTMVSFATAPAITAARPSQYAICAWITSVAISA